MGIRSLSTASISTGTKRSKVWDQSAVYLTPAYESIATVTLTTAASTITVSSIPSTYKSLRIVTNFQVNGPSGAAVYGGWLTINGDTGANYSYHGIYSDPNGTAPAYGASNSSTLNGPSYTTSDATNIFSPTIIDIVDYANTNKYKTLRMLTGTDINASAYSLTYASGSWRNTSAINSITFSPNTGFGAYQYVSGSAVYVYGIKG